KNVVDHLLVSFRGFSQMLFEFSNFDKNVGHDRSLGLNKTLRGASPGGVEQATPFDLVQYFEAGHRFLFNVEELEVARFLNCLLQLLYRYVVLAHMLESQG